MKEIIDGKRYDTETANLIGGSDNLHRAVDSVTDFGYWEADLYKTKSGNFFLCGSGGPQSMFSRSVGQNSWSGGSGIVPMSPEEAFDWAQRYLDPDDVEKNFDDMIEDA